MDRGPAGIRYIPEADVPLDDQKFARFGTSRSTGSSAKGPPRSSSMISRIRRMGRMDRCTMCSSRMHPETTFAVYLSASVCALSPLR